MKYTSILCFDLFLIDTIEQGPETLQYQPEKQAKIRLFPDTSKSSRESTKESSKEVLARY